MTEQLNKKEKVHLPSHINTTKCDLTCRSSSFPFPLLFSMLLGNAAWTWMYIVLWQSELSDTDVMVIFPLHILLRVTELQFGWFY